MKAVPAAKRPAAPSPRDQLVTNLRAGDQVSVADAFCLHFMPRIRQKLGGVPPVFTFLPDAPAVASPHSPTPPEEVSHVRKTRSQS